MPGLARRPLRETTDIDGGATVFLADRVAVIVNAGTVVASKKLTIGLFCDHDKKAAINFGDFDFAACTIGSSAGSVSENLVDAGSDATDAAATDIDLEAEASVPAGGALVTLYCQAEFTNTRYIDAGATLTATKTAATVVQVPDNTAISDTGGMPTTW